MSDKLEKQDDYDKLATEEPERDVETPTLPVATEEGKSKSLIQKMEEMGDLTDMQAILLRVFPEDLGDAEANAVMVSRISPDVFLALHHIMTNNEIMMSDPEKPINVIKIVQKNYSLLSIGLDGKGRIDAMEIGGAAREMKERASHASGGI